jgi:hypothetical protein
MKDPAELRSEAEKRLKEWQREYARQTRLFLLMLLGVAVATAGITLWIWRTWR